MERIDSATPNLTRDNIDKLAALFPDVVTEARDAEGNVTMVIDFDALRDNLSDDIVDGYKERYQFTWPGKREAKLEARRPTKKAMHPCPDKSVDWDTTENLYIEGDNLDALKIMHETYAGKVKMIYIDPPYNTGHDFIYDDDFSQTSKDYESVSGEYDDEGGRLVFNTESNGRFHSDWCSMMYPRLWLARDLLTYDGVIFISIDDNESKNLRAICDEVFGAQCFVGDIIWQRTYSIRNDSKGIPLEAEHLVVYSKQANWNPNKLPRTAEMNKGYDNPDGDRCAWMSGSPVAPGAVTHQGMVYAIQHPFTGEMLYPSSRACWRYSQDQMLDYMNGWCDYHLEDLHDKVKRAEICGIDPSEVREGVKGIVLSKTLNESAAEARKRYESGPWPRFYFTSNGNGGIRRKVYLDSVGGRIPTNLWPFSEVGHTDEAKKGLKMLFDGSAPFDTPKPVRLLDRILTIASDKDSLVMDFFSGSATMGEAVMRKNAEDGGTRRYILVQLPEETSNAWKNLCAIGEERIRRAGAAIREEVDASNEQLEIATQPKPLPDLGFRVLKIGEPCVKDLLAEPVSYDQDALDVFIDNADLDADPLDILFQVLPAFRIPYSATIAKGTLGGKEIFNVNNGQLIACFDNEVDSRAIQAIAREQPLYAVFRDSSFKGDSEVTNLEEIFKSFSPDTVRKVI